MPKTNKHKNDLRGMRNETVISFIGAAFLSIVLLTVLSSRTAMPVGLCAIISAAAYAALIAILYYFLEKRYRIVTRDETLAPVMGKIMFDTVVKLPSPVFICDSEERIIWYNAATDGLYSSKNKLYGEEVSALFGVTVEEIRSSLDPRGMKITCDTRSFYAKYSHIRTDGDDFSLITTTETTELDTITEKMNEDEVVVCYIIIDNLGEMMQYDSELYRPASVKIDTLIREWADENDGILKEYERDKYIYVTRAKVLRSMIDGKFEILEKVRSVKVGDSNLPLTISLGVGNIVGSFEEKEKAAHTALDMALQRGGDQAAVKGDGSIDFYGGATKGIQKRTNIRARVVSNELISAVKNASNVIIMGHKRADFDAFGACVGLARLAMSCGSRVNIAINLADRNLMGCRDMLSAEEDFLGVFVSGTEALDLLETGTLVIVADVNNLAHAEEPELAYRTEKLAIIDHHRKMSEFEREPDIEYIEPSASATCEIVADMLEQVLPTDSISATEASLMLSGISLDTKQFTKNTGTRTFSAAMYLRDRGANPAQVQNLFRESFENYRKEAKFRQNVEIYRGVCAITVVDGAEDGEGADNVIAAKAADNLLMVERIRASFALITLDGTVHISARSTGNINVQLILEHLGGGGHYDMAGAQCAGKTTEEVVEELKKAIDAHIK